MTGPHPSRLAAVFLVTWWSAGTPRLRLVCALIDQATRLVEPDCSLSCLHHFWHRFIGCLSRLFILSLVFVCTLFSRGALQFASNLWTDVRVFLLFGLVRPAFEVKTKSAPWPASCGSRVSF